MNKSFKSKYLIISASAVMSLLVASAQALEPSVKINYSDLSSIQVNYPTRVATLTSKKMGTMSYVGSNVEGKISSGSAIFTVGGGVQAETMMCFIPAASLSFSKQKNKLVATGLTMRIVRIDYRNQQKAVDALVDMELSVDGSLRGQIVARWPTEKITLVMNMTGVVPVPFPVKGTSSGNISYNASNQSEMYRFPSYR